MKIIYEEETGGERIDKWLPLILQSRQSDADGSEISISRSYAAKLIKEGHVLVNGKTVKPSYELDDGDEVLIDLPKISEPEITPENIPLDILYEDCDVIVVNKPKGMVVHPSAGHFTGTLVNALMYHCKDGLSGINGVLRPGIVHRIDMNTTGSVIACKNDKAHKCIADQLKEHTIKRCYVAICNGVIKEDELTVDAAIGRNKSDRKKMAVRPDGKPAVTHVKVLKRFEKYTYVECRLETGRTHQIRVHMTHIGHPLLGDEVYGKTTSPFKLDGQCLHAKLLGFIHPSTGEYIETVAPIPEYFDHLLSILK